jgi:hypothetical protein
LILLKATLLPEILILPGATFTELNLTWATRVAAARVEATLLASGLVTIAFLLAMRLLIRDFFSIDIACSLFRF